MYLRYAFLSSALQLYGVERFLCTGTVSNMPFSLFCSTLLNWVKWVTVYFTWSVSLPSPESSSPFVFSLTHLQGLPHLLHRQGHGTSQPLRPSKLVVQADTLHEVREWLPKDLTQGYEDCLFLFSLSPPGMKAHRSPRLELPWYLCKRCGRALLGQSPGGREWKPGIFFDLWIQLCQSQDSQCREPTNYLGLPLGVWCLSWMSPVTSVFRENVPSRFVSLVSPACVLWDWPHNCGYKHSSSSKSPDTRIIFFLSSSYFSSKSTFLLLQVYVSTFCLGTLDEEKYLTLN